MKPHKAEGSICFKGTNVTEKNEELPLSDIYVLYHTSPYPGRTSNAAGEQIKLLQENMVSRRIGGHTLLHRYPAVIREIPTVDIIAGESAWCVTRPCADHTRRQRRPETRVFRTFSTLPVEIAQGVNSCQVTPRWCDNNPGKSVVWRFFRVCNPRKGREFIF